MPFLLKNIGSMWQGTPLTNGHPYTQDFVCDYDTEMVAKIKAAGFLLLGRTNTPEGGWSIGTEPRLYGPTRNPWNSGLTPGGSSGGAAAAVASRMVPLAEASDGGGSIRVPASCCGLVGLKPSRGRITYGPQAPDYWLGSVSTFCVTRTVRDTAAYLDAVAGGLPGDPYTAPPPATSWLEQSRTPAPRLRIGYTMRPAWNDGLAPEVVAALRTTLKLLDFFGHAVEEHDIGVDLQPVWSTYNRLNAVETAADFDRLARHFGRAVRQDEVAPVNWSLIERGREKIGYRVRADGGVSPSGQPPDRRRPGRLRRVRHPDTHPDAAAARLLVNGGARSRRLSRSLVGCRLHVLLQPVGAAGDLRAGRRDGGRGSDRRPTRRAPPGRSDAAAAGPADAGRASLAGSAAPIHGAVTAFPALMRPVRGLSGRRVEFVIPLI